jgi:hypothetical protein
VTQIEEIVPRLDAVKHVDRMNLVGYKSCGEAPKACGELRFGCTLIHRAMRSKSADSTNEREFICGQRHGKPQINSNFARDTVRKYGRIFKTNQSYAGTCRVSAVQLG